jgi:hypothetical protein
LAERTLNRARGSNSGKAGKLSVPLAKEKVLKGLRDGLTVRDAMLLVDRKPATYIDWRKTDDKFKAEVDRLRDVANAARRRGDEGATQVPSFPEFCEVYLDQPVPEHHMRTLDLMEGREPRNLHPAMKYRRGRENYLLINYPPDHAKSTAFSVNFPTYQVVKDPNTRGAIISKTGNLARQFLGAIKNRLTNPRYSELQKAFAPEGGFEGESWTQSAIYVGGRNSGEKDPTVQALGMGAAVYGARLDWVVLDDCIDTSNAHRFEEQLQWLSTEVLTRLPDDGLVMILGTRIAAQDLYRKLREMLDYDETTPLYTYLAQPAVLDAEGTPADWNVLWPARWPGPALARRKATLGSAARWALVYQQQDVSEEATFPPGAVEASVNRARAAGSLTSGVQGWGETPVDPSALYVVGGLDPATTGKTAMIVSALNKVTGQRIVLDGFNKANCPPLLMREKIVDFTKRYKIKEWVIERNAFQRYLTQDEPLKRELFGLGCVLREHWTGSNKYDEDFGVMSLAPLFMSCVDAVEGDAWRRRQGGGLIDLPNRQFSTFVDELVEQLIVWMPGQNKRTVLSDLVMALWFTEIAFKRILDRGKGAPKHSDNPFLPRRDKARRQSVNLAALRDEAVARRLGAVSQ